MHPVLFHIGAILIPSYGALAAAGVLLALLLAQRTAHTAGIGANQLWNLCVFALCAALIGSRLLLIAANWRVLFAHPVWALGIAMIHHPLVAAAGALAGALTAFAYARWQRMPLLSTADALAGPFATALAFEQFGALLAGSGYGSETSVPWAVVYNHPLALRWSGTPLGIPLHPVQAYAAIAYLTLALLLMVLLPIRRQQGDVAGSGLIGMGVTIFVTEFWRDWEGRGALADGAIDGPQIAAVGMVIAGALLLRQRSSKHESPRQQGEVISSEAHHG